MADSSGRRAATVRIISTDTLVPATPTHRHSYFLSCLDMLWRDSHYNQRVIFYEGAIPGSGAGAGAGAGGRAAVVNALKSSLALCLVHYYPWCGRLSRPAGAAAAEAGDRLFIDCNDAGVQFVEALLDIPISYLSAQGFQTKPFYEELCQTIDHTGDCLYSSPLLSVQATFFSDGGLALGITQSHVVADGQALWNFMVSWGECARGLPLSLPPLLDRQVLDLQNLPVLADKVTWELFPSSTSEEEGDNQKAASNGVSVGTRPPCKYNKQNEASTGMSVGTQSSLEDKHNEGANGMSVGTDRSPTQDKHNEAANGRGVGTAPPSRDHEELGSTGTTPTSSGAPANRTPCVFMLPSSAINQLKIEGGGVHTSYEVTCAHFWQRLTLARQRPPKEPTHLCVLANCRRHIKPPLSTSYFGNVIGFGASLSTSGEICSESFHATASRIHDSVVGATQEARVLGLMRLLEGPKDELLRVFSRIPKGKGVNVASSPRFPVYEVDFGWERPVAVRSPKVPGEGELVFFGGHPKHAPGDVEICTRFPTDVLRSLLVDPLFLGKPVCDPFEAE